MTQLEENSHNLKMDKKNPVSSYEERLVCYWWSEEELPPVR